MQEFLIKYYEEEEEEEEEQQQQQQQQQQEEATLPYLMTNYFGRWNDDKIFVIHYENFCLTSMINCRSVLALLYVGLG